MGITNIRQVITIYPRWYDQVTRLFLPIRCILRNCTWSDQSITTSRVTGNIVNNVTVVRVFIERGGREYIPPHIWEELPFDELGGFWTVDLRDTPGAIIVPYESDHEFKVWGTSATPENTFRNNTPGARSVADVSNNMRGTPRGQHILLRC